MKGRVADHEQQPRARAGLDLVTGLHRVLPRHALPVEQHVAQQVDHIAARLGLRGARTPEGQPGARRGQGFAALEPQHLVFMAAKQGVLSHVGSPVVEGSCSGSAPVSKLSRNVK